ncbi:Protein Y97E10AR.6, partial [Aphelenchoides avenae]
MLTLNSLCGANANLICRRIDVITPTLKRIPVFVLTMMSYGPWKMSDKKEDASAAEEKKAVVEDVAKEEHVKDAEESSAKRPTADTPEASKKDVKDDGSEWFTSGALWGASWVQSAKQKTLSTLEMVKKDLNEFTDTVQNEATALASATAESVKHQAQLFQQFVTTPDGADEQEPGEAVKEEQEPTTRTKEGDAEPEKKEAGGEAKGFGFGWMKTVVDAVQKLAIEDTTQDEDEFTEKLSLPRKTLLDQ